VADRARVLVELVSINFGLPGISMMKLAGMIGLRVCAGCPASRCHRRHRAPGLLLTIACAQLIKRGQDYVVVERVLTAMKYAAGALLASSACG
jgi:chromate transport protein ChrA